MQSATHVGAPHTCDMKCRVQSFKFSEIAAIVSQEGGGAHRINLNPCKKCYNERRAKQGEAEVLKNSKHYGTFETKGIASFQKWHKVFTLRPQFEKEGYQTCPLRLQRDLSARSFILSPHPCPFIVTARFTVREGQSLL